MAYISVLLAWEREADYLEYIDGENRLLKIIQVFQIILF